ncbi:MAG: hypothetical protein WC163_11660, partial [Sulfurovum sp.]
MLEDSSGIQQCVKRSGWSKLSWHRWSFLGCQNYLLWKPLRSLSFGLAYRSEIELDLNGDADYQITSAGQLVYANYGY